MNKKIKELSIYEGTSLGRLEDVEEVEKKDLLLKDLCARLPYGIKVWYKYYPTNITEGFVTSIRLADNKIALSNKLNKEGDWYPIDEAEEILIKPYLRPMSSMTEEEEKEYAEVIVKSQDCSLENSESATTMANDWLLSKGFDVRGLISKGLALEASKEMYKEWISIRGNLKEDKEGNIVGGLKL